MGYAYFVPGVSGIVISWVFVSSCLRRGLFGRVNASADAFNVMSCQAGFVAQGPEDGIFLVKKVERSVELSDPPGVHNQDAVVIHCTGHQIN